MPITNPLVIGSISAEETKGIPWCPLKNPTTPAGYTSLGWYRFRYIRSMHSTSRVTWLARTSATLAGRLIPGSGGHCSYESANRFGRFNAGPATIPHLGSAGAYDLPPALRIASSGWGGAPLDSKVIHAMLRFQSFRSLGLEPRVVGRERACTGWRRG